MPQPPYTRNRVCFRRGSSSQFGLATLLLGALLGYLFYHAGPERQPQRLYNQGHFREASLSAREALSRHGDSHALQQLALLADTQWLVPLWQETLLAGDCSDAFNLLAATRSLLPEQTDTTSLIDLLYRITSLHQLMADLSVDKPEGLIRHRQRIHRISASWVSLPPREQQVAVRLFGQQADFQLLWHATQAQIAGLASLQSLAASELESLLEDIDQGLTRDALAQVDIYLRHFNSAHPNPSVTDELQRDLAHYRSMLRAHHEARLPALVELRGTTHFSTSIFERHARRRFDTRFPPAAVIAEYIAAEQAWRAGQLDKAFDITRRLTTKPRGEIAARHLLRFEAVSQGYDDLLSRQDDEDFIEHLKRYQAELDPSRDQFFILLLKQLQAGPIAAPQAPQPTVN